MVVVAAVVALVAGLLLLLVLVLPMVVVETAGGSAGGPSGGSSGRDELLNVGVRRFELVFAKALGAPWPAGPQDLLKTPFTETARVIGRTAAHLLQTPAV